MKTSLKSGTKLTAENTLLLSELPAILKVCRQFHVTTLQFGDIYVEFGEVAVGEAPKRKKSSSLTEKVISAQQEEAQKSHLQQEISLKEEELSQMLIENPSEYERLIMSGELDNATENLGDSA